MTKVQIPAIAASHAAADYIEEWHLAADAVRVRLVRIARPVPSPLRFFAVEIDRADRAETFESEVAAALKRRGFTLWISGCGGNGIVVARADYRAPRGYRAIREL